jgi:predicted O-methyltransferase YrrM
MPVEQANVRSWGATPATEEKTPATDRCKNPERWTAFNQTAPEVEVLKFIRSLVRTVKPMRVVICGDETGDLSSFVGHALRENGFGAAIVCGITDKTRDAVFGRVANSGLMRWVQILEPDAMDVGSELDMVFVDCPHDAEGKLDEKVFHSYTRQFLELLRSGGLMLLHDVESVTLWDLSEPRTVPNLIRLPTPRGLAILQK